MKELVTRLALQLGLLMIAFTLPGTTMAEDALFPRPPGIEPLVSFWIDIYTKYDRDKTIIHDADNPAIRYETLETGGMSEAQRRAVVKDRREHYSKVLENLALKPHERWNEEETRIASFFPPNSGIGKYLEAAGKVHSQRGITDQFRDGLVRSGRWKDTMQGIFQSYGIPVELAALPHVESSFNPDAISKAGAAGVWQFTQRTGRRFMRIDRCVDERRDVYVSTHAAARYLLDAYGKLGSWPLTVTSYNHGVDGMLRARREVGSTDIVRLIDEYDGPYFGFASKNFYAEFLAALDVVAGREVYFGNLAIATPDSVERYVLPSPARFSALAGAFAVPADALARLNPALTRTVTDGRLAVPSGVVLNIPAGRVPDLPNALASIPPAERRGRAETNEYQVRSGDTLGMIARAHGVSVSDLQSANNLGKKTMIVAGQRLSIPGSYR
jgi:membrane-bound lytic murein transglycosylase D